MPFFMKMRNNRPFSIVFIVSIIVISYSLFFYLQYVIEKDTKERLVAQQRGNQTESTKKISNHIASDLNSIVVALHGLANSVYIQQGNLSDDKVKKLMEETYFQINTINVVDRLFIIDKNNIASVFIVPKGQTSPFFGSDNISFEELVNQTRTKMSPAFSNGFKGLDNELRIAVTYPILNRETQEYIGSVVALIPTEAFFEHYGNLHDINIQYLSAFDRKGTFLAHPLKNFIGKNFFGSEVQQFIKYNKNFNELIHNVVLSGRPDQAIYDYGIGGGERLSTGYPILAQGKPMYFIFVVTPTSIIYSQVNQVLFLERIEMFLLLAGTTVAITLLMISLLRWSSSLGREVKRRTRELEELNKQLASANEQLKVHDKMQKEFINVAAHELRTPLQPIISYSALALKDRVDKVEAMRAIDRHAHRLGKLATDLLAVSRIEGGNLPYKIEKVRINDVILDVVNNAAAKTTTTTAASIKVKTSINNNNNNNPGKGEEGDGEEEEDISIDTTGLDYTIGEIDADKDRITQVLSNVMDNAIKFTQKGIIKVESHHLLSSSDNKNDKIEIKISDNGGGIPKDILPNLFTKFVSKSVVGKENKRGSGLGLFISKAIVNAHNGEITAYNNDKGGATFTIVLPVNNNNNNNNNDNSNNQIISSS